MEEINSFNKKKAHKPKNTGGKLAKKKSKAKDNVSEVHNNPKAFAFKSAVKAEHRFRRKQDLNTKKQHIPVIDRTPIELPPLLVAVVGPPNVGKTTLIINLVKLFTKAPLSDVKGPVTLVTGKKQRITLIECNNDINSMIDLAKVADLVLLLTDASVGFEMELFEFLDICKVHGMPKIIGVLTHLDMIKNQRALKNTKKTLKHRFWTEVYAGAKLFYLSGIIHGEYLKNEIKNLGRFISITKLRPLMWRSTHSYFLVDRLEDLTNQELIRRNAKCNRNILLYGYLRGVPLNKESYVHIAGVGDQKIQEVTNLNDPCPLPEMKKRALIEKEKLIYSPFSGIGGIVYDKDAVYVELGGSHSYSQQREEETYNVSSNLMEMKETLDEKMKHSKLQIFSNTDLLTAEDISTTDSDSDEEMNEENAIDNLKHNIINNINDHSNKKDAADEEDLEVNFKEVFQDNTASMFPSSTRNLMKLIYDNTSSDLNGTNTTTEGPLKDEIGGLFKLKSDENQKIKIDKLTMNAYESSLPKSWNTITDNWINEKKDSVVHCFVTGKWRDGEDAEELLKLDDLKNVDSESDEFDSGVENDVGNLNSKKSESDINNKLLQKKMELKKKFDAEYENNEKESFYDELKSSVDKQSELNKKIFENMDNSLRVEIEGCRPGMYIKVEVHDIPAEFVSNFDPSYPVIVGAVNMGEENIGYINVKLKKHRWYNRILKTNDPLIISMGWRRFQTIPLFYKLEDDLKCRYLKYTPQHVSCHAQFWGPVTPQSTGFLALQSVNGSQEALKNQGFRIVATGAVTELDQSTKILKKLKLIGYPIKIYKRTAFITGMFNSLLEVAKFEGAKINTVSGIRGQIKKGIKDNGTFRATFEDKIVLSDIVVCRTWCVVSINKFYFPVTNLLLSGEKRKMWQGVRTTRELKIEKDLKEMPAVDSLYTDVTREPKVFKPLVIPKKLQAALPYVDKPKNKVLSKPNRNNEKLAIIKSAEERNIANMMKMLKTTYKYKQEKLKETTKQRVEKQIKEKEAEEMKKRRKLQSRKKNVMRLISKKSQQ